MAADLRQRIAAALEHAMQARRLIGDKDAVRANYHLDMAVIELAKELEAIDNAPIPPAPGSP